jgi:hypothetical protein
VGQWNVDGSFIPPIFYRSKTFGAAQARSRVGLRQLLAAITLASIIPPGSSIGESLLDRAAAQRYRRFALENRIGWPVNLAPAEKGCDRPRG